MLEKLAIKTVPGAIWGGIKSVPREAWYGLAAFAAWWCFSAYYIEVGEGREAAKWKKEVAQIEEERDAALLVASEKDALIAAAGNAAIEKAQKELEDATKDIPDQTVSARQRARACYELQRQGRRCPPEPERLGKDTPSAGR